MPVGVPRHVLKLAALEIAACCSHVQKGREIFLFPTEQKPISNILSDVARQSHTISVQGEGAKIVLGSSSARPSGKADGFY